MLLTPKTRGEGNKPSFLAFGVTLTPEGVECPVLLVQGKIRAGRVRVRLFEDENDKGTALTVVLPSNLGEGLHENIILELA